MRAAGITVWRDWDSTGRATTQERPLTPQEQTTVQAVLAAHDPTKRERDRLAEDADRRAKLAQLDAATTDAATWTGLTAAQRQEAQRVAIRVVIAIARRLMA